MKRISKAAWAAGIAGVVIVTVLGMRTVASQGAALEVARGGAALAAPAEPGVVQFPASAPQLSSLRIAIAAATPMPVAEPVNGRIVYDESRTARISSPVLGRVLALRAEVGDHVARNAALLELDSPDLAGADADWSKARADEVRKRLAFERSRNLFANEVIARKDFELAEADYRQATAETQRARLRMKNLQSTGLENGRFALRSPIAGVVADRQANPGMEVRPDQPNPLFVVTDIEHLWVVADVPERSIDDIKPGQAVSIETDAFTGERFPGTVDRIGVALDPVTHRLQVRCGVPNPTRRLRPEMFARVAFLTSGEHRAIQLPNTSLVVDGIHSHVFVETRPGRFERRRVRVALKGNANSYIDTGIAPGDRVVTEGALLLNAEVSSNAR
jgi:cobalt-zinc-cadmium efflux system membrane fusion protein